MLIGYSMPAVTAVALAGSAGSAWLTSDNADACFDGKPARKARLQWASGSAETTDYVQIDCTIAATSLRVCAILGLANVPAGTVVHVYGKRAGDAGVTWNFGGQNTGTVVQFADGTCGAWFVLPEDAAAVEKIGFRIYNNAGGITWATAATTIDIGELVAMPAVDVLIDRDWAFAAPGSSTRLHRGRSSQVSGVPGVDFRRLGVPIDVSPIDQVRGGGLANGMNWQRLQRAFSGAARVVAIPRWQTTGGEIDDDEINATALYGIVAGQGEIAHMGGDQYRWSLAFEEVPAT